METLKALLKKQMGSAVELRTAIFRMMLLTAGIVNIIVSIMGLFAGFELRVIGYTFFVAILLLVFFALSLRSDDIKNLILVLLMIINCGVVPMAFLSSGGIASATPLWMLFVLVLCFVFLEGWRLALVVSWTFLFDVMVYTYSTRNPEAVIPLENYRAEALDSCMGIAFVGILIGIVFKYFIYSYEKSKKILEAQKEAIEQLNRSQNLFFSSMNHEIRTPINTIIGLNELIQRADVSDEVAEYASNIQDASKILLALINDILDVSKIESGKMEIVPTQYDTASLFSDLVNIIWIRAHEKNLEFKVDIDENIPAMLYGDEVRIKQVLINILTNAVKYTKQGSVILKATGEKTGNNMFRLKISVEDTGIGIKRESMDDLFSSFKRVDEKKNRNIEGTGLGLSISKQLVDMMGGEITVDSIYTKGSNFTVSLSQQIIDETPLDFNNFKKMQAHTRKVYKQRFEAPGARILIVDDNEMNLKVAAKLLKDTKVQIDTASSGMECLSKTQQNCYHVIFMDHMMPELDGEETLEMLHKQKEGFCQNTPVVALTANTMPNATEWYKGKGFQGYLSKPISGDLLELVLQKFLPDELINNAVQNNDAEQKLSSIIFHSKKDKICITTDCVCDVPFEWLDRHNIKRMYYYITTDEGRFQDIREISSQNLLKYMEKGKKAVSSPATVEEYEAFFADALVDAEKVIHISMAAGVSKGHDVACRAAKMFDNVTIVDSGQLSSSVGLIALYASKMAREGLDVAEICKNIEAFKTKISTSILISSMDGFYYAGRATKMQRDLCNLFDVHPVLYQNKSKLLFLRFHVGTMEAATKKYIHYTLRNKKQIDNRILFITHAGCSSEQLQEIKREVELHMHFEKVYIQQASSTITSNCGVRAFGLMFLKK